MKTELLVQLDGLAKSDDLVFLLAASNLPWFESFYLIFLLKAYELTTFSGNLIMRC